MLICKWCINKFPEEFYILLALDQNPGGGLTVCLSASGPGISHMPAYIWKTLVRGAGVTIIAGLIFAARQGAWLAVVDI